MYLEHPKPAIKAAPRFQGQACFALKVYAAGRATERPRTRYFQMVYTADILKRLRAYRDDFKKDQAGDYRKIEIWLTEPVEEGNRVSFKDIGFIKL